jgi:signal transduction histidine kinase/CheY-like chemotaxis protein/HAMP domain-containing protein
MNGFSSLRIRLVGTVFVAAAPAWLLMWYTHLPWTGFVVGLVALAAAWYGGERFILRQVRLLSEAAKRLAIGDMSARAGITGDKGELGELAQAFDSMAAALELRVKDREKTEKMLLNRAFQQTVVGAIGQFALVNNDFDALLNQVVLLVSQTLEVEYCGLIEIVGEGQALFLRAGVGWKPATVGKTLEEEFTHSQVSFILKAGEPAVFDDLPSETRFRPTPYLIDHGVIAGVTVHVAGHGRSYGLLGVSTTNPRKFTEDEVHFLLSVASVLAMAVEKNRTEGELNTLASFVRLNPNPALELTFDGSITYHNPAAAKLAESVGKSEPAGILPGNPKSLAESCQGQNPLISRQDIQMAGRTLSWTFHPVPESRVLHCYGEDVTDRISLEAQLRQSQKMDSIGQLAAGVAHDFNNMLTIIQGHSGMLMAKSSNLPDTLEAAQAIYFAAERAATLTRQLLMFTRKNVMQPKPIDLREVVENMGKMLQRLLGETIRLEFQPPPALAQVRGDSGMVEQVIMNLAVNARDAMPKGGAVVISTEEVSLDDGYVNMHAEARPGHFVCVRVTDSGCGMSSATMARIFEPFFTTKEIGRGTGLGLATVYGIVKQHEGWVEVSSELNKGSVFSVFFPASSRNENVEVSQLPSGREEIRGGEETILIVEDEPVLRDMAKMMLSDCGYKVLEASTGKEAIGIWREHGGSVDLLLTDMVMPEGMSGMDLAESLLKSRPQLKIIFASGYSMDELDTDFVHQGHALFLQKPYTHMTLSRAVRDVLDGKAAVIG